MPVDRPIEQATAAPGEKRSGYPHWCPYGIVIDDQLHLCALRKHADDVEHEMKPVHFYPSHVLPQS